MSLANLTRNPIGLNPERFVKKNWLLGHEFGTEFYEDGETRKRLHCGRHDKIISSFPINELITTNITMVISSVLERALRHSHEAAATLQILRLARGERRERCPQALRHYHLG